ncbi:hypothetical protein IQ22_03520 [Pseudomonas duriflava]|uniref:Uncharacterized protein n=1 Tax=Pseudomonas duriflava TaxID=459528 RepID=A0A562Q6K9_9PSED|nr:hypothetical protein [Pseudomonas duriflava]TWI52377.1 hypothetical protein IQ22_03520 [Pseudomonas duriflava]
MRALAEFIMRGRMQATLVVVIAAFLPLLYWLSAAAGSLIVLRRGAGDAAGVVVWALLPAVLWWWLGDPSLLLVFLGTLALASALRSSVSWPRVLLASVLVGSVFALVLGHVYAEPINLLAEEIRKILPQMIGQSPDALPEAKQAQLKQMLVPVLTGLMASFFQITCLLSLMLGRHWQAALYNPGGFAREFHALRLPPVMAFGVLLVMLLAPNISIELGMLTPLCSVPLAVAGVALAHGLVKRKHMSGFWLVGLYVTLLVFGQLIYPLLVIMAVVDSLFDFRGRLADTPKDSANGEG